MGRVLLTLGVLLFAGVARAGLDVPPPPSSRPISRATRPKRSSLRAVRGCAICRHAKRLSPGAAPCYVSNDATRPTVVQAANVTTDSSGPGR